MPKGVLEAIRTDQTLDRKTRNARNKRLRMGIPTDREVTEEDVYESPGETRTTGTGGVKLKHTSDKMITMYAAPYGSRRAIPEGSVRVCMSSGLFLECPVCGEDHPDEDACPTLPAVQFRRCPVSGCGKVFRDDRAVPEATDTEEEGLIPTDLPGTPAARTMAKLEAHMIVYHVEAARRAGLLTAAEARKQ